MPSIFPQLSGYDLLTGRYQQRLQSPALKAVPQTVFLSLQNEAGTAQWAAWLSPRAQQMHYANT